MLSGPSLPAQPAQARDWLHTLCTHVRTPTFGSETMEHENTMFFTMSKIARCNNKLNTQHETKSYAKTKTMFIAIHDVHTTVKQCQQDENVGSSSSLASRHTVDHVLCTRNAKTLTMHCADPLQKRQLRAVRCAARIHTAKFTKSIF